MVAGATVPAPLTRYEVVKAATPAAASRSRVTATAMPMRFLSLAGVVARWCPPTAPGTPRPCWAAAGDAAVTVTDSVREKESCAPAAAGDAQRVLDKMLKRSDSSSPMSDTKVGSLIHYHIINSQSIGHKKFLLSLA
jgi:hypothetical protein